MERYLEHRSWICPQMNTARPHWILVSIVSGNGTVPSGNKPLPWANVDPDQCHHMVTLGHSEWKQPKSSSKFGIRKLRFTLREGKSILIFHSWYHCCWWPGDPTSQHMSSDDIDLVCPNYANGHLGTIFSEMWIKNRHILQKICPWKCCQQNVGHYFCGLNVLTC